METNTSINDNCTIACNLPDAALRKRKTEIATEILSKSILTEEIDDGYRFAFSYSDTMLVALAEFINVERQCCPFINFHLILNSNSNNVALTLTGAEGTKDFIKYELEMV